MRSWAAAGVALLVACSQPSPAPSPRGSSPPSITPAVAGCRLPLWWLGRPTHAAFLKFPTGAVEDVGEIDTSILGDQAQHPPEVATYTAEGWLPVPRKYLSPDESRYVYWDNDLSKHVITVVDLNSGARSIAYDGPTLYVPIAFASDGIYLVKVIVPPADVPEYPENLYRLGPGGGAPQLVRGSDRHMSIPGWTLIADGAAWGLDYSVNAGHYTYSLLRLDLSTFEITKWFTSPDEMVWPMGVDARHRLFVATETKLWRVDSAGLARRLPDRA